MAGTNFASTSKTVGELLSTISRSRIVVPTFQRGYEWGKKHVEAFWTDIQQFEKERGSQNGSNMYFLGPIVVLQKPNDITELLDGQQRLATATILLSVLRDIAKATGVKDGIDFARDTQAQFITKEGGEYALQLGETDEDYFRDSIQNDGQVTAIPKLRTHRNILVARAFLTEKVSSKVGGSNPNAKLTILRSLRQILVSDLVFACIPVESERDAFRIFETLNDRGLRLSVPDLLLNYLMRLANPEKNRKQIRDLWTEMVERMGKRDINRFLRHMWVSKYGDLKSTDLFSALKEHIEKNEIGSLDFARSCRDECEYYVQLITINETHLLKATKHVRSLLQGLDSQAALPLLLSAFQKLPPAEFVKVCQWLLVFVVRYSVIASLDASGLETVLFELARDVRNKMTTKPDAKPNEPLPSADVCIKHIKDTLIKNAPSDNQIKSAVVKLVLPPDEAGYVLGRLAQYMQTDTKELQLDETNLEHIFPKNPEENEWGGKSNQELLEPYLWHIGNLTMLGERLNKNVGNKEFDLKKTYYAKNSELKMAQKIASDYTVWTVANIEHRASALIKPVQAVWNFDNSSRV
jgi:hypothetical protein